MRACPGRSVQGGVDSTERAPGDPWGWGAVLDFHDGCLTVGIWLTHKVSTKNSESDCP